jgi:peroxiredoxin
MSAYDPTVLPAKLPVPEDDGAAAHLPGTVVPSVELLDRRATPQSLGFRDAHSALTSLGARVVGLSAQTVEEQREFAARVDLPYPLLSDPQLHLAGALALPTFDFDGSRLYKRITLVLEHGRVAHAFYPVFPPNENAAEVTRWLGDRRAATA